MRRQYYFDISREALGAVTGQVANDMQIVQFGLQVRHWLSGAQLEEVAY